MRKKIKKKLSPSSLALTDIIGFLIKIQLSKITSFLEFSNQFRDQKEWMLILDFF